jgi:cytochrome P450
MFISSIEICCMVWTLPGMVLTTGGNCSTNILPTILSDRDGGWHVSYLQQHAESQLFFQSLLPSKICCLILGEWQFATIEPENVKALLATKFPDFSLGVRHNAFYPLLGDGIFNTDGELWSHSRALLRPQFSREQVRGEGNGD